MCWSFTSNPTVWKSKKTCPISLFASRIYTLATMETNNLSKILDILVALFLRTLLRKGIFAENRDFIFFVSMCQKKFWVGSLCIKNVESVGWQEAHIYIYIFGPINMMINPILYFSMCVCVCYRFSRQPLNRLLWNLARCFEMISERQLTILVSIGCIFNELSRMRYALYWARIRFGTATVTWQWFGFTFINALSSALSDVKHLGIWRQCTDGLRAASHGW